MGEMGEIDEGGNDEEDEVDNEQYGSENAPDDSAYVSDEDE